MLLPEQKQQQCERRLLRKHEQLCETSKQQQAAVEAARKRWKEDGGRRMGGAWSWFTDHEFQDPFSAERRVQAKNELIEKARPHQPPPQQAPC